MSKAKRSQKPRKTSLRSLEIKADKEFQHQLDAYIDGWTEAMHRELGIKKPKTGRPKPK